MTSIIGSIVKTGLSLTRRARTIRQKSPARLQKLVLKQLLSKAAMTQFGRKYHFEDILHRFDNIHGTQAFYAAYKALVPTYHYNTIFKEWWAKTLDNEPNVCWPGKVHYFALSSGTSEASSKHIPVTKDMIKAYQKASTRQIFNLPTFNNKSELFSSGVMVLGGSTDLTFNGHYYEGDLSGIQAKQLPAWFGRFYKPGKKIALMPEWDAKIEEITINARSWNIGIVGGVPSWVQMLLERIIDYYKVDTIHDIWPNFGIYIHGGVSFEPYRKSFEKLLGKPVAYVETYMASEGCIAYQPGPGHDMRLVLDNGIFFEFVPFDDNNFTADGEMVAKPTTLMISEVEKDKDYALLLSTCAGAWRYLIGDVIRFTNVANAEIKITGRTKHFISLCGEHLSVDNMTSALAIVGANYNVTVKEFCVAGYTAGSSFGHHWYIGSDEKVDKPDAFLADLDSALCTLNDDYPIERRGPLRHLDITVLPSSVFYGFMKANGKEGGQNKFPRVLKKGQLDKWNDFLLTQGYDAIHQTKDR